MVNAFFSLINTLFIDCKNNAVRQNFQAAKVKISGKELVTLFRINVVTFTLLSISDFRKCVNDITNFKSCVNHTYYKLLSFVTVNAGEIYSSKKI